MSNPFKTVYVYTGDRFSVEKDTYSAEALVGEVTWDEGGVLVRRADRDGAQRFQVPWSAVKYITWREEYEG